MAHPISYTTVLQRHDRSYISRREFHTRTRAYFTRASATFAHETIFLSFSFFFFSRLKANGWSKAVALLCSSSDQFRRTYVPVPRESATKITSNYKDAPLCSLSLFLPLLPIRRCQHFCTITRKFCNLLTNVASFAESERIQWFNAPSSNSEIERSGERWSFICFKNLLEPMGSNRVHLSPIVFAVWDSGRSVRGLRAH